MTIRAFVSGGARSGKSALAERLVRELGGESVLYVATADTRGDDPELQLRVREHRLRRPAGWRTFEVSYSDPSAPLAGALEAYRGSEAVLLDSLTLWISGLMSVGAGEEMLGELDAFLDAADRIEPPIVVVTDEVGLGLVPESSEGRRFRDLLGLANQRVAAAAEEAYLCVSGVPLRLR
jgi:adenosylcobinamide kinase/adenosylcobinamide-phosphate guanylyltransferase